MTWVPILFGVFKVSIVAATFVLCVKSQREGEREDRQRREASQAAAPAETAAQPSEQA